MRRRRPLYLLANLTKARAARVLYSEQRREARQHSLEWIESGRKQLGATVYGRESADLPDFQLQADVCIAHWEQPEFQPKVILYQVRANRPRKGRKDAVLRSISPFYFPVLTYSAQCSILPALLS